VLHFPKFRVVKKTILLKFNKFSEILNAAATCETSKELILLGQVMLAYLFQSKLNGVYLIKMLFLHIANLENFGENWRNLFLEKEAKLGYETVKIGYYGPNLVNLEYFSF
jgi:hypothetical protein